MNTSMTYNFSAGTVTFFGKNIMLINYSNKQQITTDHLAEVDLLREKIIGNTRYYTIIDLRDGFISFSREAKAMVAKDNKSAQYRIKDIVLISHWGLKMEVAIYNKIYKPTIIPHIATSLTEAFTIVDKEESHCTVKG